MQIHMKGKSRKKIKPFQSGSLYIANTNQQFLNELGVERSRQSLHVIG